MPDISAVRTALKKRSKPLKNLSVPLKKRVIPLRQAQTVSLLISWLLRIGHTCLRSCSRLKTVSAAAALRRCWMKRKISFLKIPLSVRKFWKPGSTAESLNIVLFPAVRFRPKTAGLKPSGRHSAAKKFIRNNFFPGE